MLGDLAARLGDVAHDGEGGMEKDGLLLLAGCPLEGTADPHAPIEAMADPQAQQEQGTLPEGTITSIRRVR